MTKSAKGKDMTGDVSRFNDAESLVEQSANHLISASSRLSQISRLSSRHNIDIETHSIKSWLEGASEIVQLMEWTLGGLDATSADESFYEDIDHLKFVMTGRHALESVYQYCCGVSENNGHDELEFIERTAESFIHAVSFVLDEEPSSERVNILARVKEGRRGDLDIARRTPSDKDALYRLRYNMGLVVKVVAPKHYATLTQYGDADIDFIWGKSLMNYVNGSVLTL